VRTVFSEINGPKVMRFDFFLHSLKSHLPLKTCSWQVFFGDPPNPVSSSSIVPEGLFFTWLIPYAPLNRISFALFLLCFTIQTGFAGQGSVRPVKSVSITLVRIEKLDSILSSQVSVMEVKKESETDFRRSKRFCRKDLAPVRSKPWSFLQKRLLLLKSVQILSLLP